MAASSIGAAAAVVPLASLWLCARAAAPASRPEQIHIGLGRDPGEMTVHWTTIQPGEPDQSPGDSLVAYGLSPSSLTEVAQGRSFLFRDFGEEKRRYTMHIATMRGLAPSTTYYYKVGGKSGWSLPYGFKSAPSAATLRGQLPMTYAVYGDQGDYNGQTLPSLKAAARRRELDMVLHVGDMAYDFDSDNGRNGDAWMRDIEPLAATVPYMVSVGNHEAGQNYNHYTQRFRNMPSNTGNISFPEFGEVPNNWWYSWDSGLVHFVALSTEVYFTNPELLPAMHAWLGRDLAGVDRLRTPWVVAHGHRPLYCSCDADCDGAATTNRMGIRQPDGSWKYGLEELFYKHGVDLYIAGHEHDYERMFDVAPRYNAATPWLSGVTTRSTEDPPATTYIVTGSAGNVENHEPFTRKAPARSAKRLNTYGWSRLAVHNATHLLWQQVQTDSGQPASTWNEVVDETWIVQRHHGPFPRHPRRHLVEKAWSMGAGDGAEPRGSSGPAAARRLHAPPRLPSAYAAAECRRGEEGRTVCQDDRFSAGMRKLGRWQFTRGLRHSAGEDEQVLSI